MAAPNFYPEEEKPLREFRWGSLYEVSAVAVRFFLEIASTLVIFSFCATPLSTMGPPGGAVLLFGLLLGVAFCLGMLGSRYRALRERAGGTHWSVPTALAVCLVLPPVVAVETAAKEWSRHHFKARQSEAKIALSTLYVAEESYFSTNHAYTTDFRALGYEPEGGRRFYVVGAPLACEAIRKYGQLWLGREAPQLAARKAAVEDLLHSIRRPSECRDAREGFELVAVGVPLEGGGLDVWTINEKKELKNEVQGI